MIPVRGRTAGTGRGLYVVVGEAHRHGAPDAAAVRRSHEHLMARIGDAADREDPLDAGLPHQVDLDHLAHPAGMLSGPQPELFQRLRLRTEARPDDHRVGIDQPALGQDHPRQPALGAGHDPLGRGREADVDARGHERVDLLLRDLDSGRDQHGQALGQLAKQRRDMKSERVGDELNEPLVTDLVPVAKRAVQHLPAPVGRQPLDGGQLIHQAGGDDDPAGHHAGALGERDDESFAVPSHPGGAAAEHLSPVVADLRAPGDQQVARRRTVAAEEAVHVRCERVARRPVIHHDHRPALAAELQGGGQPSRRATDDGDVAVADDGWSGSTGSRRIAVVMAHAIHPKSSSEICQTTCSIRKE